MPYNIMAIRTKILQVPLWWRIGFFAAGWLVLIAWLHLWLNFETGHRDVVLMGYMPVITNLACPLLDQATKGGDGLRFEALKFVSFADMCEALRNGQIQAAFMIAPLSIVLRQQGEDVKVVYIGNRHESTLVVRKDLDIMDVRGLRGKTVAVPMRYSGHNICVLQLVEKYGLEGQISIVEMNPPDMASALTAGDLDAYFVGEPFAAQTIRNGCARVIHFVEDVWPCFICNLMLVRKDFIDQHPGRVEKLVQGAARSGLWAQQNCREAAEIASCYWNQPVELVEYALTTPPDRTIYDRFIPMQEELQYLADQMVRFHLLKHNDITGLIEDRFARTANLEGIADFESVLNVQ